MQAFRSSDLFGKSHVVLTARHEVASQKNAKEIRVKIDVEAAVVKQRLDFGAQEIAIVGLEHPPVDRLYGTATRRSFGLNLAMEIRIVESRTRKGVGAEGLVAKHARAATEMHSESGAVAHPIRQACTVQ